MSRASTVQSARRLACVMLAASSCLWAQVALSAEPTSETNRRLEQGLKQYPEADADGDGILTRSEAKAFLAKRKDRRQRDAARPKGPEPTHADVAYGPFDRNRLDLWLAPSAKPTPLVVCIHGGGFKGGDKKFRDGGTIEPFLEQGISVAAINYRLTDGGKNPFPIPMHDGARAIQFLRYHAAKYNLDKPRLAAMGGSAGGCMSLWLAFHDDLADPENEDPVLRESTRLCSIAPSGGQSSLDFDTIHAWFECEKLQEHEGGRPLFAVEAEEEFDSPRVRALMREASPITHLTVDDPPVYMTYGREDAPVDETTPPGVWVHHPRFGIKLKEQMDALGLECHVQYPGGPPITEHQGRNEFIIKKLLGQ